MAKWLCLTEDVKDTWIRRVLKDKPLEWPMDVPTIRDLESYTSVIEAFSDADKKEEALKAIPEFWQV